jgi:hypothetical protein
VKKWTGGRLDKNAFGSEGRRLYLIDAENMEGQGVMSPTGAEQAKVALMNTLPPRSHDHVVVATSHPANAMVAKEAWPSARHVVRHGHDGADLALLDVLGEGVGQRFTEVVLASGDGIFTDQVAALIAQGVPVTVLSRPTGLSHRLRATDARLAYLAPYGPISNN